jgi:two-component system cell cycle response regulator CtrA
MPEGRQLNSIPRGNMQSAQQEVERLLGEIRQRAGSPRVEALTDQISVLCRGYMEPLIEDHPFGLTKGENRLFQALKAKIGRTVSKGALLDALAFDKPNEPQVKIIDVWVCKMRKKLIGSCWNIETVWGKGYRLKYDEQHEARLAAHADAMMRA